MKNLYLFTILFFLNNVCYTQTQQIAPPVKADTTNPGNCYNVVLNMVVPNGNNNIAAYPNSKIVWEYTSNPPSNSSTYIYMGTSNNAYYAFVPLTIFGGTQISTSITKYLRVRHLTQSNVLIATSVPIPIVFSPSAPIFHYPEVLNTTPSCPSSPTGSILINHTRFTDSILYIVKNASDPIYCNPITNNPPCFNVLKSGKTADTNFVITNIPPGVYNVFISNIGGTEGTCNNISIATVLSIPPIQITNESYTNPKCYDDNNGKIILNVTGGDPTTYHYSISPNVGTKNYINGVITFDNLPKGNYFITFTDTCGLMLNRNILLTQPPKVVGSVLKTVPTCTNPGNGIIKILAGYNINTPGYNKYDYRLYKDGFCIDSLINTTDTVYTKNGLVGGNYTASATATLTPNCVGIYESFLLPFNTLLVVQDSVKNVNCNGGADGYIKLKAIGGTYSYIYYLKNNNTGVTVIDTSGTFPNLIAANYIAYCKNKNTNCTDSSILNINITQPNIINTNLTKQDIQCYNYNNGSITATVTGGNGGYNYYWEKQNTNTGGWSSYYQVGATINSLNAGTYRSKIIDSKNCLSLSTPVTTIEPDSLHIDSVKVYDIPCYSGSGFISVYSSGGNTVHTQQYKQILDTIYTTFTPTTGLAAGKYFVRVIDNKGCTTYYNDTLTITSPPSNLDFTYTQAQINGYNITCFGADNGAVTITANGGNGYIYTGYTYTYDNQPWQASNIITNIPAGNRIIKVKDGRGCIVAKPVLFTQPNDSLTTQIVTINNIACNGATTGSFSIKANGGVKPYKYSINGGATYQPDSTFTNLAAGTYIAIVKDNNNCAGYRLVTLVNTNMPITQLATIATISCNGGNNGSITTTVTGGVAPYNLLWTPSNATTPTISNLLAGTYKLKVTDAISCTKEFNITVTQPTPLAPVSNAYPVCYGAATGKIIVTPNGGTAPYLYSKDNGVSYQTDSSFINLPQATYAIKVKDSKNCIWSTNTIVGVISNNPNLNFLISSNQHALDTITMKEISWIRPDSIQWQYHPAAIVIDANKLEPKIRFNAPDTGSGYWVRLIGYYPTCTYTTQKIVKIFPYDANAVVTPATYNKGIKKAELFPNPNNGQFTLNVEFYKMQKVTTFITSLSGVIVSPKQTHPITMNLVKNFTNQMDGNPPGTYVMRIVSDYDSRYILFVKN